MPEVELAAEFAAIGLQTDRRAAGASHLPNVRRGLLRGIKSLLPPAALPSQSTLTAHSESLWSGAGGW